MTTENYNGTEAIGLAVQMALQPAIQNGLSTAITKAVRDTVNNELHTAIVNRIGAQMADLRNRVAIEFAAQRKEVLSGLVREIKVCLPNGTVNACERQHYLFPLLVTVAQQRIPAYLCGPAGSFKTSTAHNVAKALGLPFYSQSVCSQTSKTDLLGYMDANGRYIPTLFRRAYENGGLFLLDEIDLGNANVIAVLNAALANGGMGFPDGMITAHPDFLLFAGANTWAGANNQYIGRNQLDAATLDRFAFIDFPYDQGLESTLAGIPDNSPEFDLIAEGVPSVRRWVEIVRKAREQVIDNELRMVISPRATLYGTRLAKAGVGLSHLVNMLICRGCDGITRSKVTNGGRIFDEA